MILNDEEISKLIDYQYIRLPKNIDSPLVQPASLDLPIANEIYEAKFSSSRISGESCGRLLHPDSRGYYSLKKGHIYIAKIDAEITLPRGVSAKAHTKSSIGRLGALVRLIGNSLTQYDYLKDEYMGDVLYAEIIPLVFDLEIARGAVLTQLRFRTSPTNEEQKAIKVCTDTFFEAQDTDHPVAVGPYTEKQSACAFFKKVENPDKFVDLKVGKFYLFKSKTPITILGNQAAHIDPYLSTLGEMRVHYAGFVDPGFSGHLVLEVRAFDVPIRIHDNQFMCVMNINNLTKEASVLYGEPMLESHYANQDLRLSRYLTNL